MNVAQFFDPDIRQWAETLTTSSVSSLNAERIETFRVYATEQARKFTWDLEHRLSTSIQALFEERQYTKQEARDYLEWAADQFCDGLLHRIGQGPVPVLPLEQPAHIIRLDWPLLDGGDAA